jgi:putative chitinase
MRTLTAADILRVVPHATRYANYLASTALRFSIDNVLRQAHWLGQMHVESGGFEQVRESLNYKTTRLVALFGDRRITPEQAQLYGKNDKHAANPEALANILYGGAWGARNLGNMERGDGWRFIGRGLKQITGRANYLAVSMGLYGDDRLLHQPALLEGDEAACLSAGYFWDAIKHLNPLADQDDIYQITKKINGGTNGLEGENGRREWVEKFKIALAKDYAPDFSNVTGRADTVPG